MNSISNNINQEDLKRLAAREGLTFFGLTLPYLIMVIALIAIPVGWLFYLSFIGRDGTLSLENYERMWKSKAYIKIFITTFKISILTTIICAAIGYPLSYFMSQLSRKWANICMIAVLIPFWTSLLVRTYAWLVLLRKKGLINNILIESGLITEPLKFVHNTTGTLIGMVHIMLPFLILPL